MRIRTTITGASAAALCVLALWFQFYKTGLNNYVPGWAPGIPRQSGVSQASLVTLAFCILILFVAGWVSARWNWANTWQSSIAAGASSGLLAGFLIYDIFGVFWFGVIGHTELLGSAFTPMDEAHGIRIIVDALINTNRLVYINFIWCVLACVSLGMLGGFVSALVDIKDRWGRSPRHPEGWLFRIPAYLLVFFGFLNLIVTVAVMELMTEKLMNTLVQMKDSYGFFLFESFDKTDFLLFNYLVGWSFMMLPLGLIIGWFIRFFRQGGKLDLSSITWLSIMAVVLIAILIFISPELFSTWAVSLAFLISLVGTAGISAWVGWMTRDESEGFPYHSSDWVGYLAGYGIMGATQIIMGSVAYALPVALLGITNVGHLAAGKAVEQYPAELVRRLYELMSGVTFGLIVVCAIIALITVNLVTFFRNFFDIREVYPSHSENDSHIDETG